ncbi:PREDICTED: uncharacterized protein LOC109461576 [Branchiostoma belcheri]|uniref:Uncharacterized protein LOC109461576 n=1 Tax=Branchiostoma belcheri TaxID=7741 RepID=A0A6P4Y4A9_BRABE|nr:PREDICTED: uncharacterized protein LOC109461576 [Branchiostoma belcheri]
MSSVSMASLANRLQKLCINSPYSKEVCYDRALREAIASEDHFMEVEVLKSLGDLRLEKAKLSKDSAEFDKAAALYAAALLRCKDPDVGETVEHRIRYMEKLSRQLLQGYSPHYQSPDYWGSADSNVLRVAETCLKLERSVRISWHSLEVTYTKTLVTAIENSDMFLELEVLKSLGDFYLEKGKKTSDVSQFSKAAAMYNKALTTCGDPEAKLTLQHRVKYAEKTKEAATQEGDSSLARSDLDSAEQHFAAALKTVHVKDPTAQQYQREVEPLCKLGDVYSKRGQQTGDGGDFVKAAALYNAAIARSEDQVLNGNIAIKDVEKSFLKCILDKHSNFNQDDKEKHKKQLKEMRDQSKLEMETIDQQLDPYVHDEDDPCVREIEAKRAQAVRQLFEKIAQQRKEFISLLVEECIGLMGPPPCKYALIGLGSQATGLVTPYSDLEFAILVEEKSEVCLVYFRNLTHYLHLKVVNLGETILPALGIKSLNDYSENPLDNWYYDSVTPRGFAFDGSMPKASKTPLGRQGTKNKPPSELICTPENMVSILQKDVALYLKEGYHLASILRNPCLIAGDQDLIDTYMAITGKILQADGGKMAQQLAQETLKENNDIYKDLRSFTARLVDVKKDIYRFPAVAVDCLALSSGIIPTTVWETIEEMENQQVISPNNAHHLTVLTSISAELRLRTYIANGGQKENLSAMASIETEQHGQESSKQTNEVQTNTLKQIFYLPNEKQLFRYYHTALFLKYLFLKWFEQKVFPTSFPDFYATSATMKAMMYDVLCKYDQAVSCYQEALKEADEKEKIELLNRLGEAWQSLGDYRKAISYLEQAMLVDKSIYSQDTPHPEIANSLRYLGSAWHHLGDHRKAMSYFEQALQMYRSMYGQTTPHPNIASSLNNLGVAWHHLGDYRKAISYLEQALQMHRSIYGQTKAHPDIAMSLNNLGVAWSNLGDYRKAISSVEQALQMHRSIYGQTKAHPNIAMSLNNLGTACSNLGDYRKAISYHEQVLQMERSIYGQTKAHPDIATSLNNLGGAWHNLGDYRKAISYHEQALQMYRSIYGQTKAHPVIATSLNNLGGVWHDLGDYRKAISYLEQALQMCRSIYGQTKAHPDIAGSLNNLGSAWHDLGDHRKAISYLEQSLQMQRSIYGQTTPHPNIATSLNRLGSDWYQLGDYRKAISYFEQSLQMRRSIYGHTKAHLNIVYSLNNLASAWYRHHDHSKALSLCQEALAMARQVFPQNRSHPLIKNIEQSLANMIHAKIRK